MEPDTQPSSKYPLKDRYEQETGWSHGNVKTEKPIVTARRPDRAALCWAFLAAGLVAFMIAASATSTPPPVATIDHIPESRGHSQDVENDIAPIVAFPSKVLIERIIERPLFSPTRRATRSTSAEKTAARSSEVYNKLFQLVGIIVAADRRMALFRHQQKGWLRLRRGQRIDQWQVRDIDNYHVWLARDDHLERLALQEQRRGTAHPRERAAGRRSNGQTDLQLSRDSDQSSSDPEQEWQELDQVHLDYWQDDWDGRSEYDESHYVPPRGQWGY